MLAFETNGWIFNTLGYFGDVCIVSAYFLLYYGKLDADNIRYILLNLFGATGLMLSLIHAFNWPVFFIEVIWILISLYGLFKWTRKRHLMGL